MAAGRSNHKGMDKHRRPGVGVAGERRVARGGKASGNFLNAQVREQVLALCTGRALTGVSLSSRRGGRAKTKAPSAL